MTRSQLFVIAAALTASIGAPVSAQSARMTLRPESKVMLAGGSNVHAWACNSSAFNATIELDSIYQSTPLTAVAKPITTAVVTIPVRSLKCGNGKMDNNLYKALKADEFPDIKYVLGTYEVNKGLSTADAFATLTVGELTVAGKTTKVEIPITATRKTGGTMTGKGTVKLQMTDFGVKPPVALMGMLHTRNEIEVTFQVILDRTIVVALTQQP